MDLNDYCFPVVERKVAVHNGQTEQIDLGNTETFLPGGYKAIVREDTNELISIVKQSYQVVPNETLIYQLMEELEKIDTSYKIEESHSFVENSRMRLQIVFPEILISDSCFRGEFPFIRFIFSSSCPKVKEPKTRLTEEDYYEKQQSKTTD